MRSRDSAPDVRAPQGREVALDLQCGFEYHELAADAGFVEALLLAVDKAIHCAREVVPAIHFGEGAGPRI